MKPYLFFLALSLSYFSSNAQCITFSDIDNSDEIEEAHILYRDALRNDKLPEAFSYWLKVFTTAPGTNGRVSMIYRDGISMCIKLFDLESDDFIKLEICETITSIMEKQKVCFPDLEAPTIPDHIKKYCHLE